MSLADKFNLLDGFNLLRIVCALFFIPHIIGKFTVPQTLEFYVAAGFKPPKFWMYLAAAIETVLALMLFFGIYTTIAASLSFIHLSVAAIATYRVTKCWIWVTGGIEYCAFWALVSLALALHAYKTIGL
ncbi:MAG: DoxX family protein [Pseudolabrys sp.]|nr:DoxX family protein [Pseudolabrys sp.]